MAIPRLMVTADLAANTPVPLTPDQARYLATVLRLETGAPVRVFNGRDGEWTARLDRAGKRAAALTPLTCERQQAKTPDVTLLFAPLKKTRTDFVVEKATELGVATLQPVFTAYTNAARVNVERLSALAVEAAEQSERLDAPMIHAPARLDAVLDAWAGDARDAPPRPLLFADETSAHDTSWAAGDATTAPESASALNTVDASTLKKGAPFAALIGPEGGFSPKERARLRAEPFCIAVNLGPRILRADTAALALLTLAMARWGDWGCASR